MGRIFGLAEIILGIRINILRDRILTRARVWYDSS